MYQWKTGGRGIRGQTQEGKERDKSNSHHVSRGLWEGAKKQNKNRKHCNNKKREKKCKRRKISYTGNGEEWDEWKTMQTCWSKMVYPREGVRSDTYFWLFRELCCIIPKYPQCLSTQKSWTGLDDWSAISKICVLLGIFGHDSCSCLLIIVGGLGCSPDSHIAKATDGRANQISVLYTSEDRSCP